MIRLENVTKIYSSSDVKTTALKDVNLKIKSGELVAIVGNSGSGKTTLLNIIGGLDSVTEGKYFFDDLEVSSISLSKLHKFRKENISFVFQDFQLVNSYTAFENIEMPLIARGKSKKDRERTVLDTLAGLDITDIKDKFPHQLSGGQKQRVAIARALVCDTSVILADEPTGSLDTDNGLSIMDLLIRANRQGKTVIIITHNTELANKCDRIIRLKDGHTE